MAKGKSGMYLEAWKFGIYLLIPVTASWYYNDPARQQASADYWQYIRYPANPNTGVKEEIQRLSEQRKVYREQMKELSIQADRTAAAAAESSRKGWFW